jgi:hypothetical protein
MINKLGQADHLGKIQKCNYQGCKKPLNLIQREVMSCCQKCFCQLHRLPEDHNCLNMETIKQKAKDHLAKTIGTNPKVKFIENGSQGTF